MKVIHRIILSSLLCSLGTSIEGQKVLEWQTPSIVQLNKEAPHATLFPFEEKTLALASVDPSNKKAQHHAGELTPSENIILNIDLQQMGGLEEMIVGALCLWKNINCLIWIIAIGFCYDL